MRFGALALQPGQRFGLSVLAFCGGDPCARCAGANEGTVALGRLPGRAPLALGPLAAGTHRVTVFSREARETATEHLSPRLDLLVLTNDPALRPSDDLPRQELP